jgi:hypothetical protein
MGNWVTTVEVNSILKNFDCSSDEEAHAMLTKIADLMEPLIDSPFLDEAARDSLDWVVEDLRQCYEMEEGEYVLSALYDWADEHRVWLGI